MNSLDMLFKITVMLTMVLAFSLVIERFLEILNTLIIWIDGKANWYNFWTNRTYALREKLEKRLRLFEYIDEKSAATILRRCRMMLLNETGEYDGTVPVLSGNLLRAATVKLCCKFVGLGLGIGIAFWIQLDLITIWKEASGSKEWIIHLPWEWVRIVLSGIVIGLGSAYVHKIITSIEKKNNQRRQKGVTP